MFEDDVLQNLTRIWNFPNNQFHWVDGKQWTNINPSSLAQRLNKQQDSIVVALKRLKTTKKIDLRQDGRTYFYSLSPEATEEETKAEAQEEVFAVPEDTTKSVPLVENVFAGLSAQDKWKRWTINCNMEWNSGLIDNLDENGVPDGRKCSTTHRFKNIQQYFSFRRTHDVDPYVYKKMKKAMDDWLCPNIYWEGLSLDVDEWNKCGIKVKVS